MAAKRMSGLSDGGQITQISIVLAEDQKMIAGALAQLLNLERDMRVLEIAPDGKAAYAAVVRLRPAVLVTDIEMPGMTGLELATKVKQWQPETGVQTRIVMVTAFARPGYLRRALDAGVRGYLLKDSPSEKLAEAIRTVVHGGRAIAPELAQAAWSDADPLTDRERAVLRLAGIGRSGEEIAAELHLSPGTVRNYLSNAMSKLMADNRIEAYQTAMGKGWL
jgi:two-component system, NarL family, response regulator DesR